MEIDNTKFAKSRYHSSDQSIDVCRVCRMEVKLFVLITVLSLPEVLLSFSMNSLPDSSSIAASSANIARRQLYGGKC